MTDRNARELLWATVFGAVYELRLKQMCGDHFELESASRIGMQWGSAEAAKALRIMADTFDQPETPAKPLPPKASPGQ